MDTNKAIVCSYNEIVRDYEEIKKYTQKDKEFFSAISKNQQKTSPENCEPMCSTSQILTGFDINHSTKS